MKIYKRIIPLVSLFVLAGCNNYDKLSFPKITDDEALEVANKIYNTQISEGFKTPDKITIETNNKLDGSRFDYYYGKYINNSTTDKIDKIDMTNLMDYSYKHDTTKLIEGYAESTVERYRFYDSDKEILYVLMNYNGNKIRTETQMSKDEAKIYFDVIKLEYDLEILNNQHFKNFKANAIDHHQGFQAYYKDKKDESFAYMFGSEDKKSSLQDHFEGHIKAEDESGKLQGYEDFVNNDFVKDNMLLYTSSDIAKQASDPDDSKVYIATHEVRKKKYQYNVADIKIPNINDYKI